MRCWPRLRSIVIGLLLCGAGLASAAGIEVRQASLQAGEDGGYELVFPMVAAPRPGTIQIAALPPGTRSSHDISLAVELDAGVAIQDVRSPSHRLVIARPSTARAQIHLDAGDTIPNKDFILRYDTAGARPELGALAYKDGETGSFLLLAQPPSERAPGPGEQQPLVPSAAEDAYAAREAQAKNLENFKGGDVVVITSTTVLIILVVVLILIII